VIRVLAWTNICLLRAGLAQLFDRHDELSVVGVMAERTEALARLAQSAPDVVILDLGIAAP